MNTTTNLLKINGRDVYADRNYLLSEAAILAGKSVQTLRLATKQIDERRLNAKIARSNGRMVVTGTDLWNWSMGFIGEPARRY
jgi:hypothetical protein